MRPGGFALSIRENCVDEAAFGRLIDAVDAIAAHVSNEDSIDRLVVGCFVSNCLGRLKARWIITQDNLRNLDRWFPD